MKIKNLIRLLSLTILITFLMAGCKKSKDNQPQTTMEKIQGKWALESEVENQHSSGQDNITNTPGQSGDVIDFRNDGKVYSDVLGNKDTSTYTLSGDTKIVLDGAVVFDIKTLSSTSFIINNKQFFGTEDFDEVTISLKR